jgi:hypothetical protein
LDGRGFKPNNYPNGNFVCETHCYCYCFHFVNCLVLLTFSRWHPLL